MTLVHPNFLTRALSTLIVAALMMAAHTVSASDAKPTASYVLGSLFGIRQTGLSPGGRAQLDDIAVQWSKDSDLKLVVKGFTDSVPIALENRQEFSDNYALSLARAEMVGNYLKSALGKRVLSVEIYGFGPDNPVADNRTASGRARNRRVEVQISGAINKPVSDPPVPPTPSQEVPTIEELLQTANGLLSSGDTVGALALLQQNEGHVGNPDYDYLYGLALRGAGKTEEAMFALERVIAVDPSFAGARLELAQIYLSMGAKEDARRELFLLQGQNAPPAALEAISQSLSELTEPVPESRFRYYLRSAAGFDGNANSATDLNTFLGFTLSETSRETSTAFSEVGGGLQFVGEKKGTRQLLAYGDLGHRFNFDASFVNATTGRFGLASRWKIDRQSRSVGLQAYRQNVSGDLNSQGASLVGNWNFDLSPQFTAGFFGRGGVVRFGDSQSVKDVNQFAGGGTAVYRFASNLKASLGGVILFGTDDATENDSRYDRDFYGLRVTAGWLFSPRLRGEIIGSVLQSDYDAVFFPEQFTQVREDTLTQLGTHISWRLNQHWVLDHYWNYQQNDTDVSVFDYDRVETHISATRLW